MQDVSKILTRKYYGKKDPFRSREFRQPRWMELLAVLLFTVSGLGEGKSINVVLGGLPKAVTLAFVGLAGLEFFIRGDFDRLKKLAGPSGLYILYLAVLAAWSMFIWVRNFTAFASITRGVEKILYQSIATVVAICCVYLYGRFSIDLFTIGICCANLFILFSEVPAYGVGESVSSLLTSILSLGNNTYGYAERLEIHEVTFLEGIFVLYYLFFSPKETKQQRTRNWVLAGCSFFFVLAGMKRILLPALVVSAFYIWVLRRSHAKEKLIMLTGVAICCVYLYGRFSIDLFTIGICCANLFILFSEVPAYGVGESVSSLLTSILSLGNNTYGYAERLEIHEVTFLEGIFVLYYLFFSPKETKQQRTRNWVLAGCSFFFVLAGMKRILLPALVVSAFYIWVLRRSHAKEKLIMLTGVAWVTLFWVYLYLVHTGAISRLLNAVGINMMGRDYIWSLAKPYYQFSPTFIGLGFEAVDAMVTRFYEIGLIDVAYPLHNDILKVFVELGFPGLCFWCAFLYLILPWYWTKRYGPEAGILYFAILNPLSMTYLTDNTAFYFWCTMGLRMIPLAVCCFAKPTKDPAAQKQTWQPPSAQEVQRRIRAQYREKGSSS